MIIGRNEAAEGQAVNPIKCLRCIGSRSVLQHIAIGMLLSQVFVIGQLFLGFQKFIRDRSYLFI